MSVVPTVEEIHDAITSARASAPFPTGAPSLHKKIKSEHPHWALGLQRLKNTLGESGTRSPVENGPGLSQSNATANRPSRLPSDSPSNQLPAKNALQEQLEYQQKSTRYYRIYGNDGFDYGVTFNSNMGIFFNMMQTRAQEEPAQRPAALYYMYDHLQYAAIKAGVPKEDLRRQLWDEFDCDPLLAAPPEPRTPAEKALAERRKEQARQEHKKQTLALFRVMLQEPAAREYIKVDEKGEPLWDEVKNGRYVVLVTKLRKGDGLDEVDTW